MSKGEKRKYAKRLAVTTKVKVYRMGKASRTVSAYLFETKDMTEKGFFLKTPKVFPVATHLRLEFEMQPGNAPIAVEGKVAWRAKISQRGYFPGMGIKITKIKRGDTKKIKEFLKQKFRNYRHAVELKKMYLQLKDMGGRLYDLEQSHLQAEHFKKVIEHAIKQIDHIAHILDREVWEVKSL